MPKRNERICFFAVLAYVKKLISASNLYVDSLNPKCPQPHCLPFLQVKWCIIAFQSSFSYALNMSAEAPKAHNSAKTHRTNIDPTSIRLENWGDLLLKRLHDSYRREENCDLELILKHDNKSVRVHGSILHVCTEYFKVQVERQGTPGRVILPEAVAPAPLLAIVQFLYTGQLAFSADNFDSICRTATLLGLNVIADVMGGQAQGHDHKSIGLPPSANFNPAGIDDVPRARVAAPISRGASKGKSGAVFAGNKRPAPASDCLVTLQAKRSRAVVEGAETNAMNAPNYAELRIDTEEAKRDVGKGPFKRLYNKVTKLKRIPNSVRSMPKSEDAVKKLTSSDVFKKYNDGGSNASLSQDTESSSTRMIMDLIKKNPRLLRDEHPTGLKIKQMSASGQERVVNVTVCTKIDLQGKRSIQIVHSPEYDAEPIRADGPWSCTRCLRVGGKLLEFSSYQGCRTHLTKVHSVRFDPNSCEQCGEKCPDSAALAHHRADRHGIQLPEGTPEKSAANKRPKVKSFSLSDLKRRKLKLKRTTVEAEPKAEMERNANPRAKITTSAPRQEDSTCGKIENGTESTQLTKDASPFTTPKNDFALSLNDSETVQGATNGSQPSPIPATKSHSTCMTVAGTTSTMALPTFQELRGIPPLPSIQANQEPIQVVNLALPVAAGGVHDDDQPLDIGQQPAIFILSNDLDQNQYFDTLFNHQPPEFQESLEETMAPQQLGHQLNLQPTVNHEQGTNEFDLQQGQQHFSYVSNDSSCTSFNHTSHTFSEFPQNNS